MHVFGIRNTLAAGGLTALLLITAQFSRAADEKKTEKPKEAPRREAPHREAPPARTPAPAASTPAPRSASPAAAERPAVTPREHRTSTPAPAPSTITPSRTDTPRERPAFTPRDPRNEQQPSNDRRAPVDRRINQPNIAPTTNTPNSNPSNRQGGFNNSTRQDNPNPGQGNNNRTAGSPSNRTPAPGIQRNAAGRPEAFRSASGNEARFRPDGRVQTVQGRGVLITHGGGNTRRIIVQRPDRSVIVTNQSGHGYVQRPYVYRGQEFSHRTYYVKGRTYTSFYRPYSYRGIMLNAYVPVRYYSPGFYGYAYRPWARPISFRWGWFGDPWYGYYGGYFSPLPYYASPSLWLVDYIIAARLAEAYQDRGQAQAAYSQGGQQSLTPEIRQAIADEVQMQLQAEGSAGQAMAQNNMPDPSQGGLQQWFSDGRPHTFVVSFTLDVTDDRGQGCTVTRGDVLQLTQAPPQDSEVAYVRVVASKGPDCRTGSMVAVSLQDLQDIQNQMRESVNQGLGELHSKAGQGGIPALPANAQQGPTVAPFAEAAPPPDSQIAAELSAQVQEADKVEQEVLGEARQEDGTILRPDGLQTPGPVEISLGQSIDQVIAAVGRPLRVANLGSKQVYIYKDMKVTFVNGKVTDVQ